MARSSTPVSFNLPLVSGSLIHLHALVVKLVGVMDYFRVRVEILLHRRYVNVPRFIKLRTYIRLPVLGYGEPPRNGRGRPGRVTLARVSLARLANQRETPRRSSLPRAGLGGDQVEEAAGDLARLVLVVVGRVVEVDGGEVQCHRLRGPAPAP